MILRRGLQEKTKKNPATTTRSIQIRTYEVTGKLLMIYSFSDHKFPFNPHTIKHSPVWTGANS